MATKKEQRHHVDSGLAILHAIRDEHGIKGPMTCSEIGEAIGCSKQLIQRIEQKALRKMRHPSRIAELNALMEAVQ